MKVKKIGIVNLSSGILGEDFIKHELEIGIKRLNNYGIEAEVNTEQQVIKFKY